MNVRDAGLFYSFMYEQSRLKGNGKVYKLPQGNIIDIISSTTRSSEPSKIYENSERLIEAKGSSSVYPIDVPIYKSIKKLSAEVYPAKYYVYIVYNIRLNKIPHLIEVDGFTVQRFKKEVRNRVTINLHKVHENVKKGALKVYDLPCLTSETLLRIKTFIKSGTGVPLISIHEYIFKSKYNDFVNFIENLGSDIKRVRNDARRCYYYVSKITGKRCPLVWIYPKKKPVEDRSLRVNPRNDSPRYAPHIRYPAEIATISKYKSKDESSDWYPVFYISTDEDIAKAMCIIKFAYENM